MLSQNMKSESGRKVQHGNIHAAKTIADVIRTCLGPKSMLKMLMDPMGGVVITNDGNAILREIQVQHPAAKSMIEISRTQDEEVGDGTTSVIVLAGEVMTLAEPFLQKGIHPTVIISGYRQALEDLVTAVKDKIAVTVDVTDRETLIGYIQSSVQTKMVKRWSHQVCEIALDAVQTVSLEENGRKEIDIKRYARVEKIPGGSMEDSRVLDGILINKDVVHPKMSRKINNPRVILLDCPLEYKKGESQTNIEMFKEEDFMRILQLEEEAVKKQCDEIIALKPDLVITEKGVSDLAQHFLVKNNISCLRRLKKSDCNRVARAVGANIASDTSDLKEEDVGTGCGLFEIRKIGDEYFSFLVQCKNPKACTILLRGPSKDILNEVDRNIQDALQVTRNILLDPKLVPGGGACEMALANILNEQAKSVTGVEQWPYKAIAKSLEVIPRTLIQNCGANTIRTLTTLRAKHATNQNSSWGIDGEKGVLADMKDLCIWDPLSVKLQVYKTAIETSILLLRIDDIVSGIKKSSGDAAGGAAQPQQPPMEM